MEARPAGRLLSIPAAVPEPRSRHGRRHPLSAILALVCSAIMCGATSYTAIAQWARDQDIGLMHRLGFTRRPPKMGGIRKVLIALNRWAESLRGRPVSSELCHEKPLRSMERQLVGASTASRRRSTCSPW
jgi:hypothetical protein